MHELRVQGRTIGSRELDWIVELMAAHPEWGRWHLSIHIAQKWNWRNGVGQLKDMAARMLLLKLERRGRLRLPPRKRPGTGNHRARRVEPDLSSQVPIGSSLAALRPLQVVRVDGAPMRRAFGLCSDQAANWIHVGQTQGRGRQGPSLRIRSASIKDIYLLPLHPRFRQSLQGHPSLGATGQLTPT